MRLRAAPLVTIALAAATVAGWPAAAEPVSLDGLTFSDELGGVVLIEGSGSGHLDDPFVLVEEITGTGPGIITIRGLTSAFGNRIGSQHEVGFALTKIVRNGTPYAWPTFDMELRRFVFYESPIEDGLSFGQGTEAGRPFLADGYGSTQEITEPFDAVVFSGGLVEPGETVVLSAVITDSAPKPVFHLIQLRNAPVARAPAVGGRAPHLAEAGGRPR
jgi:hypothetical protein